jgi:hypothetical protein
MNLEWQIESLNFALAHDLQIEWPQFTFQTLLVCNLVITTRIATHKISILCVNQPRLRLEGTGKPTAFHPKAGHQSH